MKVAVNSLLRMTPGTSRALTVGTAKQSPKPATTYVSLLTAKVKLLVIVLGLLASAVGCTQLKQIPLFNPDASLRNRIASAREVRTELNTQIGDFRDRGWITQAQIDTSLSPSMDTSLVLVDEAETLMNSGDTSGGNNKLAAAKALLTALRNQLNTIAKDKS